MVLKSEQETMQALITDALTLLCKSNLQFKNCVSMEALVGITLDEKDIILVSVKETIKQTTSPKKSPMQISLKSVQAAVQRVNAKSGGNKSPKKKLSPKGKQSPARVINIMPTNLPQTETEPVAIGTIETAEGVSHNDIGLDYLNTEEDIVVKMEDESEDGYGGGTSESLVPGPVVQAETLLQDLATASTAATSEGATNVSQTSQKMRETTKRKILDKKESGHKVPRMYIPPYGRTPVPLDVRYLGFNRSLLEDKEFKRGKFLGKLAEGELKWDELNHHQQDCVFAKAALRGREENEIVCSLCYQAFTKALEYKKHIRGHFGQFSIACSICGHECWSLDDLQAHMSTHVSFQCPLCNESCSSKLSLTTHIRNDHRIFCQDPSTNEEESPKAKEVATSESPKQDTAPANNINDGELNKSKPVNSPGTAKGQVAARKETPNKNETGEASKGKPNTMQVTVVPQITRTGSADSSSVGDLESEQEQQDDTKATVTRTEAPRTRSKGRTSKTKRK